MPDHIITEPLMTAQQVADAFGLTVSTVYRHRAMLGGIKLGGVKFRRSTVEQKILELESHSLASAQADLPPVAAGQKPRLVVDVPKPKHKHLSWGAK